MDAREESKLRDEILNLARYHRDAPVKKYTVRFKNKFFCSADTAELVEDVIGWVRDGCPRSRT